MLSGENPCINGVVIYSLEVSISLLFPLYFNKKLVFALSRICQSSMSWETLIIGIVGSSIWLSIFLFFLFGISFNGLLSYISFKSSLDNTLVSDYEPLEWPLDCLLDLILSISFDCTLMAIIFLVTL